MTSRYIASLSECHCGVYLMNSYLKRLCFNGWALIHFRQFVSAYYQWAALCYLVISKRTVSFAMLLHHLHSPGTSLPSLRWQRNRKMRMAVSNKIRLTRLESLLLLPDPRDRWFSDWSIRMISTEECCWSCSRLLIDVQPCIFKPSYSVWMVDFI